MTNPARLRRDASPLGRTISAALLALLGLACGASTLVSSWRSPTAQPLQTKGTKVAAVVMMRDEPSRRSGEDTLAREISARGAVGVPMYTIMPDASVDEEAKVRAALEAAGVQGVVVMRPLDVKKEVVVAPMYSGPAYDGYWGGYYAYGWSSPWGVGPAPLQTYTDLVVSVETLVYSLKQNKLIWGGRSRTTNPADVDQVIIELAGITADELNELGLVQH